MTGKQLIDLGWFLFLAGVAGVLASTLTPQPRPREDLATQQLLEDCAVACAPRAPELVAGACYCRVDAVTP